MVSRKFHEKIHEKSLQGTRLKQRDHIQWWVKIREPKNFAKLSQIREFFSCENSSDQKSEAKYELFLVVLEG